ncbi:conserved hypothetical protein [Thiomonas sp. X19]|uniref:lipoprotein insertase outer membrane protein LolB n=1 Tax=Thiomonas sp. X19 TaxID=1050370 RepID=UPI000B67D90C|nr:lipoprotein insertase outer membrane protein LolB [Thiomonas sp. X19]SCC92200.1 conserved hypothetical protein [Thiomonas sp. X19]
MPARESVPLRLARGRNWTLPIALGLSLFLAACAIPPAPKPTPAQASQLRLNISGRISVLTGEPPEQKNLYGGFRLELLAGGAGHFDVFSPLGQMLAQARWTSESASLNNGRQTQDYASFEDMTEAALGVALPRAALQDWVRGEPATTLPFTRLGDGAFEQLGWRVQPRFECGRLHVLRAQRMQGPAAQLSLVVDETSAQRAIPAASSPAPQASGSASATSESARS